MVRLGAVVVLYQAGMLENNEIQPSTVPTATSTGITFSANVLEIKMEMDSKILNNEPF